MSDSDLNSRKNILHAFCAASKLREMILIEPKLSNLDVVAVETMLDTIENIAIRIMKSEQRPDEDIPRTKLQS